MKYSKTYSYKIRTQAAEYNIVLAVALFLFIFCGSAYGQEPENHSTAKYVILMISDGWGIKHIEATNNYRGGAPEYQSWDNYWMSTFAAEGGYDELLAWTEFEHVKKGATDSAASATALFTGIKTKPSMISVSPEGKRLYSIAEKAIILNMAVGVVSSVPVSHATPGAWYAHNDFRFNSYAILEEGLFGDPQATYDEWDWKQKARHFGQKIFNWVPRSEKLFKDLYAGDHGKSDPIQVIIGIDDTGYSGERYINDHIRNKLRNESSEPGKHTLIESAQGENNGERLIDTAENENITKLVGLFNHSFRLADGSGQSAEDPTLAQMTAAALKILNRNPSGFGLLVEAGAVDFAGHSNNMDQMIGEQIDFDDAVQEVVNWVQDPANGSSWDNTLVIVTGDHETGYLTAGPGVFPDRPLGEVSDRTLSLEKEVGSSGYRAGWDDLDGDSEISEGETVYWAWNSKGHTNILIPLYTKGFGSELFSSLAVNNDPVRGMYIDNTDVHRVMDSVISRPSASEDLDISVVGMPHQVR